MKKVKIGLGAAISFVLLLLGVQLIGTVAASAHTPSASLACTSWQLSAASYNANDPSQPGDATPNLLSYSVDGAAQINVPFGNGTSRSGTFPANSGDHSLVAQFTAWDDPTGANGWTKSYHLTQTGCGTSTTPCPPASTVTVTGPPIITTVTATETATKTEAGPTVTATETKTVAGPTETATVTDTETAPPVTSTATVTSTAAGQTQTATETQHSTATATATVIEKQTVIKSGTATETKTNSVTLPPNSHTHSGPPLAVTGTRTSNELLIAAGLLAAGGILLLLGRKRRVNIARHRV